MLGERLDQVRVRARARVRGRVRVRVQGSGERLDQAGLAGTGRPVQEQTELVRVALHRVLACLGDEVREQAEQLLLLVEEERGELLLVRELVPAAEMWGDARRCREIWRDIGGTGSLYRLKTREAAPPSSPPPSALELSCISYLVRVRVRGRGRVRVRVIANKP